MPQSETGLKSSIARVNRKIVCQFLRDGCKVCTVVNQAGNIALVLDPPQRWWPPTCTLAWHET